MVGAGIDSYTGYGQRGSFSTIEHTLSAIVELFPMFSRVPMNRQWVVSLILLQTPVHY